MREKSNRVNTLASSLTGQVSSSAGTYTYDANGNTLRNMVHWSCGAVSVDRLWVDGNPCFPRRGGVRMWLGVYDFLLPRRAPWGKRMTMTSAGSVVACYTMTQNIDEGLAMQRNGGNSYYEADGLGSITSLTSSTGSVANTYTYDSFGNLTNFAGTVHNPFLYTGREYDNETSLYFNRARYYNPQNGRLIGEDPIEFLGGANFYVYVSNNPSNLSDPLGLCGKKPATNGNWLWTFTKSFFAFAGGPGNVPTCTGQALYHIAEALNPFTPGVSTATEAVAPVAQGVAINQGIAQTQAGMDAYVAARGLTVPLRSSIVRTMAAEGAESAVAAGARANVAVQTLAVDYAAINSTITTAGEARNGQCAAALPIF